MKSLIRDLTVLTAVCLAAMSIHAASEGYLYGVHENLTHGLADLGSCWMELPVQMYKGYCEGTPGVETVELSYTLGGLRGVYNGVAHTLGRATWGVVQIVGFWAANPADNDAIQMVLDGEYAWEAGDKTHFLWPDWREGCAGLGGRLGRGLKNALGSPAELIGQPRKSVKLNGWSHLPAGLGRGLWYTGSRALRGVADVILVPVPSPIENYGVAFIEENPWDALVTDYCKACGVPRNVCGCPRPVKLPKAEPPTEPAVEEIPAPEPGAAEPAVEEAPAPEDKTAETPEETAAPETE